MGVLIVAGTGLDHRGRDGDVARLLEGERVHRREALEISAVDRDFLVAWVERLDRRMKFDLSVSDGLIYLVLDEVTLTAALVPHSLGQGLN